MDKVPRRYNKVNKDERSSKKLKKSKGKIGKTQFEKLLVDFKQRKQTYLPPAEQKPGKITTGRITVKPGIFGYGERSEVVLRDGKTNLNEESKAILDENLFKIIDLAKPHKKSVRSTKVKIENSEEPSVLSQFDNNLCLEDKVEDLEPTEISEIVECISEESSLFKDINIRYETVRNNQNSDDNENYISINDSEIELLVKKKLSKMEKTEDIWSEHSKIVLNYSGTKDYEQFLTKKIVHEQQKINQTCSTNDLLNNYKDTPVANTLKRKFIKRFNELTIAHNNGVPMTPEEVKSFIQMTEQSETRKSQEIEVTDPPKGSSTPIKNMNFPETSYHTPENQKFVYKVPDTEVYQTCLYMVPDEYPNTLRKKVAQKENFVEVVVPKSVATHPGLYEITKKESKEFVFSPKVEQLKKKNPFTNLDDGDRAVLSKWKTQIKHVYECGNRGKKNIELGENTVINLKKNLLFDDCDNVLSRPKKICKRNRTSDESFKNLSASPFCSIPFSEIDCNLSRSEIRRKLNYSNHELSFEKENAEPLQQNEYKSNFMPISPCYNELGEAFMHPKSPRYDFKGFTKPQYSPNEFELRRKYAPHTLTSVKEETKLQVVPMSPNEYMLRKEYVPHTITSDMESQMDILIERKNLLDLPELAKTPDIKFHPRPH